MERVFFIVGVVALAGLCALAAYRTVENPLTDRRQAVDVELDRIKSIPVDFPQPDWDFDKWHHEIVDKESLWQEIVPPPPPPPPKAPTPPDLMKLLGGVQPTRQQVGPRVLIKKPGDAQGSYYVVGDEINGVTISEITKQHVIFVRPWQGRQLSVRLERQ